MRVEDQSANLQTENMKPEACQSLLWAEADDATPLFRGMRSMLLAMLAIVTFLSLGACSSQREKLGDSINKRIDLPADKGNFRNRLYAGASIGNSEFDPDLSDTDFTVQKGSAVGTQLKLGYDLHHMFSVEMDTSVLGSAELESTAQVEYTSFAASGLIYGLGSSYDRSRREKWSAFARVGYALNKVASNVTTIDGRDLSGPLLGLGVEYGFANGLGLRAEISRFSEESNYTSIGAVYRFGQPDRLIPQVFAAKESEQELGQEPSLAAAHPRVRASNRSASSLNKPVRSIIASANDTDADGIDNEKDECANTPKGTSVGNNGCGLFDGVIEGITFTNGSAGLDDAAKQILARLAVKLMAFPEVRVAVQAHTDSKGPESINQSVSETRARAVVSFLQKNGVAAEQLKAMGMGESQPRNDNETEQGRLSNRRIELKTLPDLDLAPSHVTELAELPAATGKNSVLSENKRPEKKLQAKLKQVDKKTKTASAAASEKTVEPEIGAAKAQAEKESDDENAIKLIPTAGTVAGARFNGIVEGVGFVAGAVDLTPESKPILNDLATKLKKYAGARVAIMAHTDDQGGEESNLDLSVKRAVEVVEYLKTRGISAKRLKAEGYGESLPIAQNLTEEDRARNRRIELRVLAN